MQRDNSYLDQLVVYVKKNLKKGYTKESLKWALVNQGHSKLEIERAFKKAEEALAREAPVLKTKPKITYEVVDAATHQSDEHKPERKQSLWKRMFG